MKRIVLLLLSLLMAPMTPAWAQQKLYPVRGSIFVEKTPYEEDHWQFFVEKTLGYKLTLAFPTKDQARFVRDNDAKIVVLWLRIENESNKPLPLNTEKFAATGKDGQKYTRLTGNEAFDRIISETGLTGKAVKKSLKGMTLGRVGSKSAEDDARDEAVRFTLQSGEVPPLGMKQGLIYFDRPSEKDFTVDIDLGDLWSKPFPFTNVKPKR